MKSRLAIGLALAIAATAFAAEPTWPPSPEALARMKELQAKMADPASTREERAAARTELERFLKAPGAPDRKPGDAKKPARAAIDPFPSVAKPSTAEIPYAPKPLTEPPPTARLEVIEEPRRPVVDPATGRLIQPTSPGAAVDPRSGRVLHETPGGYIDPRTGRLVPK